MLIGLHGKSGSGKDQTWAYIAEWATQDGRLPRRDAFADRMKVSAARAIGYVGDWNECLAICARLKEPGWEIVVREPDGQTEHVITGREYFQYYGDESHRQVFGEQFWIGLVLDSYPQYDEEVLVVTDVRYANEAEAILDLGGEVWRIIRPGQHLIAEDGHDSERGIHHGLLSHTIHNNRDLPHLRQQARLRLNLMEYA